MQIRNFPQKTERNDDDLVLIQEAGTNAYKYMKVSDLLANLGGGGGTTNSYQDLVLQSNPLAYWRFEEVSGTQIVDYSPNNRNLTLSGNPTRPIPGAKSNGILLGSSAYASLSNSNSPTLSGDIVVEAWIKRSGNPSAVETIISKYSGGQTGWLFYLGTDGKVYFDIRSSTGVYQDSNPSDVTITNNQWHHCVGGRIGNSSFVAIDGVKNTPKTVSTQTISNSFGLNIGRTTQGDYYNGSIDEVAIYTSLSDATIATHADPDYN